MVKPSLCICGKEFNAVKPNQLFCSDRCRYNYHNLTRQFEAEMLTYRPRQETPTEDVALTDTVVQEQGVFFVAQNAIIVGDVSISRGVNIWFGAVLRGDLAKISIGEYTNVQDLCVMHTDPDEPLEVGSYVTIGHGAIIHARKVGDRSLIGMGALLLGGAEIGEECLIGAGALVRENQVIPPRSIVVGVPGKIIGTVSDAQIADHLDRAKRYYENALKYIQKQS